MNQFQYTTSSPARVLEKLARYVEADLKQLKLVQSAFTEQIVLSLSDLGNVTRVTFTHR